MRAWISADSDIMSLVSVSDDNLTLAQSASLHQLVHAPPGVSPPPAARWKGGWRARWRVAALQAAAAAHRRLVRGVGQVLQEFGVDAW